jgi:hypothetical protein
MFILAATGRPPMGGDKPKKSEAYEDDCDQLAVWLRSHTAPGEVIHVNKEWVGDMIPLLADRPTDFGAWWECSREIGKLENRRLRDDGRRAVFVCIKPESDVGSILGPTQVMPWVDEKLDLGRLRIGLRHERTYSLRAVLDDFEGGAQPAWRPAPAGGSALRVAEEPSSRPGLPPRRFLAWSVSSAKADRAEIARPFSPGGATGIALNVRASAPTGDVLLGVMTADGSRYQWELSLPCAGRDLWLRARVPLCGLTPAGKSPNADRRLDPAQITTLWLAGPKQPSPNLEIAVDDLDLMDVTVSKAAWHARPARGAVAEGGR